MRAEFEHAIRAAGSVIGANEVLVIGSQALHASVLEFVHPRSGEPLRFESAPPGDFSHAWGEVGAAPPL